LVLLVLLAMARVRVPHNRSVSGRLHLVLAWPPSRGPVRAVEDPVAVLRTACAAGVQVVQVGQHPVEVLVAVAAG
jgi:hypothetical protein